MKLQIFLFALISIACALPVPDEEGTPSVDALNNAEKKLNLIEVDEKTKALPEPALAVAEEPKEPEAKSAPEPEPETKPESKSLPEEPKEDEKMLEPVVAAATKEDVPAERKLDEPEVAAVVPTIAEEKSLPSEEVPEAKSVDVIVPEAKAAEEIAPATEEKKVEKLPEPLATEAKEIKSDASLLPETREDIVKLDAPKEEVKTVAAEEPKPETRTVTDDEKPEEAAVAPVEEPVVAAVATKLEPESRDAKPTPAEEVIVAAAAAAASEVVVPAAVKSVVEPEADASPAVESKSLEKSSAEKEVVPTEDEKPKAKKIDNSSESQESGEEKRITDESKESSESSDEDKSSA